MWRLRGVGGQIWNEQAENVFTTARHTEHTDVKDVTLLRIKFLIVWLWWGKNHRVPVPWALVSWFCQSRTGFTQSPLPLVVSSGGIVPSIHLQTRVSTDSWRVDIEVTFALLLSLKRDRKTDRHTLSTKRPVIPPLDFLSGGSDRGKQVVSSFVSDDHWWTVVS